MASILFASFFSVLEAKGGLEEGVKGTVRLLDWTKSLFEVDD